jgi:hypothetical protein
MPDEEGYSSSDEIRAQKVYASLDEMFAAIPCDERGVLHPKVTRTDLDSGPIFHLLCGKEFATHRDFLVDERCNSGACNLLPVDKHGKWLSALENFALFQLDCLGWYRLYRYLHRLCNPSFYTSRIPDRF